MRRLAGDRVTAVVVHHEQPERCAETVAALRAQRAVDGSALDASLEIVIVDNGSSQGARAALATIGGVRVIDARGNLGYGGGANTGMRDWLDHGVGSWCLIVPHDAQPEPDCLARVLDAVATEPRAGLVSAEYGTDELPAIDPYFGALTVPAVRGTGWQPAAYAHGTFLLARRQCIEDVGLFDESFFAYCEEADLALRAAAHGWSSGIVWGAVVRNPHQGSTAALVDYLMVRNTVLLVRRHFGRYRASVRFAIAALTTPWLMARPGQRSPWFDPLARMFALRDVAAGRFGAPSAAVRARLS